MAEYAQQIDQILALQDKGYTIEYKPPKSPKTPGRPFEEQVAPFLDLAETILRDVADNSQALAEFPHRRVLRFSEKVYFEWFKGSGLTPEEEEFLERYQHRRADLEEPTLEVIRRVSHYSTAIDIVKGFGKGSSVTLFNFSSDLGFNVFKTEEFLQHPQIILPTLASSLRNPVVSTVDLRKGIHFWTFA